MSGRFNDQGIDFDLEKEIVEMQSAPFIVITGQKV